VRVIDPDGDQIGILPTHEAVQRARSMGMDLVEIAPQARPPVCKIMDYGRFQYLQDKKAKRAKEQQNQTEVKQVKFRPNIGDHDLETKVERARQFLSKGSHVKLTIMFRKREMRRPENGYEILQRATQALADVGEVAQPPPSALESRDLSMVLRPGT
jgi:translation initiation factor IF-3